MTAIAKTPPIPRSTNYGMGARLPMSAYTTVAYVDNLNESGPGSLAEAMGDDTLVIFRVAGNIDLTEDLGLTGSRMWIMGESAPSPGITIRNHGVLIGTRDKVRVSHIRFHAGTKYASGVVNDFVLDSGTIYTSQNAILQRTGNGGLVDSIFYDGVEYENESSDETLADGDGVFYYDNAAPTPTLYVDVGEDPATKGTLDVRIKKSKMPDCLDVVGTATDCLIHNCDFFYGSDIPVSMSNMRGVTFTANIVAFGLNSHYHPKGVRHSKGVLFKRDTGDPYADNTQFCRNLYAHCADRNPLIDPGCEGVAFNELVYDSDSGLQTNFRNLAIGYGKASFWGSKIIPTETADTSKTGNQGFPGILCGPSTTAPIGELGGEVYLGPDIVVGYRPVATWSQQRIDALDPDYWNDVTTRDDTTFSQNSILGGGGGDFVPAAAQRATRHDQPNNLDELVPADLEEWITKFCGARPWDRDADCAAVIAEINAPSELQNYLWEWRHDVPYLKPYVGQPIHPVQIAADGVTMTVQYSEAVTHGVGGTGGVKIKADDVDIVANYASGAGTAILTYTLASTVLPGQTCKMFYDDGGPSGDRIVAVTGGAQARGESLYAIQNNSTATPQTITAPGGIAITAPGGISITPPGG